MVKKSIRTLLEGELEKAELSLAAREFADKVQDMILDLTNLKVKDLPALKESLRGTLGNDMAEQYVSVVDPALQAAIDAITQTQSQLDQAALSLSGEGTMPTAGMDGAPDVAPGTDDSGMPPEGEVPATDDAAGASGEETLGRGKRSESRQRHMQSMLETLEIRIANIRRVVEAAKKTKKKK